MCSRVSAVRPAAPQGRGIVPLLRMHRPPYADRRSQRRAAPPDWRNRMGSTRMLLGALLATALGATAATPTSAQSWPSRPITAISPFSAGNAVDIVGRIVLEQVSQQIGQSFVIENRPGGGGTVAFNSVAKATPDGYTILLGSSTFSAAVVLHKKLPYDTLSDFTAVAPFGVQPSVLVTAPSHGFKTVAELVAAAKAKPGQMNFASAGIGAASHIAGERFRLAAGLQVQHIPYRGPVEALTDLMTGRIDFYFLPIAAALPLIKQGKVVALAVSTPARTQS